MKTLNHFSETSVPRLNHAYSRGGRLTVRLPFVLMQGSTADYSYYTAVVTIHEQFRRSDRLPGVRDEVIGLMLRWLTLSLIISGSPKACLRHAQ